MTFISAFRTTALSLALSVPAFAADFPSPLTVEGLRAWHQGGALADHSWPKERELDLNGDGKPELFLATQGYDRGMDYALFSPSENGWSLLAEAIPGGHLAFEALPAESNGFHNFKASQPAGRGSVVESVFAWDGAHYASVSREEKIIDETAAASAMAEQAQTEKMLREENLGGLRLGMSEKEMIKLIGKPKKQGKLEKMEATGDWVQKWEYPAKGLEIVMTTEGMKKSGAKKIFSITAKRGCKLATKAGIKLGSTEAEVRKIYGPFEDKETPADSGQFIAGSIYGGIFFKLDAGKVTQIAFGAGAE